MDSEFLSRRVFPWILAVAVWLFMGGDAAKAGSLTLTPAGVALGLQISVFADGFPTDSSEANGAVGPLGVAFLSGGGVQVTDAPGNVRVFPTDTDGQHASSAPPLANYGHNDAAGLAQVGGVVYMTQQPLGRVVKLNANGTIAPFVNAQNATGIVAAPNGDLFVSSYEAFNYKIDPTTSSVTTLSSIQAPFDGLSTDGTVLYGADIGNGHVLGYNIATQTLVFDSGFIGSGSGTGPGNDGLPDGTALGFGALAGNIFANTNGGDFVMINLATSQQTILASGGTRGDFVTIDPNGSLLVTQTGEIDRISAQSGGFGSGPSSAPEPGTWALLTTGLVVLSGYRRHRARL